MDQLTLWLSGLGMVAMALWIAPGVFAMNRGVALRNFAFWLAIIVVLGLVYKAFGPFNTPASQPLTMPQAERSQDVPEDNTAMDKRPEINLDSESGENFSPPQE